MEAGHWQKEVDYRVVELLHRARLEVLQRCLNHVVH